jgi:hypothetical protein
LAVARQEAMPFAEPPMRSRTGLASDRRNKRGYKSCPAGACSGMRPFFRSAAPFALLRMQDWTRAAGLQKSCE